MLFLIFSVISAFPCIAVCQTQQLNLSRVTTTLETRWLASLIPTAFSPQFVSEKCHNDSLTYLDSILRLNQDWARKSKYSFTFNSLIYKMRCVAAILLDLSIFFKWNILNVRFPSSFQCWMRVVNYKI